MVEPDEGCATKVMLGKQTQNLTGWSFTVKQQTTAPYLSPYGYLPLALAAFVVSATAFCLFGLSIWSKLRKRDTIVLTGISGSGKTVIFHQLRDGSFVEGTAPSTEPIEESFILHSETTWRGQPSKPIKVVDLPVHCKIDNFLPRAAGIVLVVDTAEFIWNYLSVAKNLYQLLTNPMMIKKKTPLLILCNKTDKLTAHTTAFIITELQKLVDKLISSKAHALDGSVYEEPLSGERMRKAFPFSNCKVPVSIVEASGLTGEIYQLELFIRDHAKH